MRLAPSRTMIFALAVVGYALPGVVPAQDPPKFENVSSAPPRTPEEERKGFHLPPGFEIELVASEPDIGKPLNLAFDARGRLWVTESFEYPFAAAEGTRPRDAVRILEDFGPDGKARKVRVFADGLNIPIGILPLSGGDEALVHSIPNIHRMGDTDGDGRADRRDVYFSEFGYKDTHGMTDNFTWGFDGWVYACHGYSNTSEVKGADGKPITMQSGNTYRMRPDGSHVEYFTHGQVNPFGLAFDPLGNVYSCDCHSRPLYQLLRGAWYPSFGKPDDGLGFGPHMVTHDHGSTAIAGIVYYAADRFPAPFRDNLFIGNVVTNRINRDRLEWRGSTPKGIELPDFLTSDDPWFRPVDLELGPDGAIYVADFYNRIIGHYEVPLTHPGRDRERGRIWRIVYRGPDASKPDRPGQLDLTRAAELDLVKSLSHPNLAVRILAANQLVDRPDLKGSRALNVTLEELLATRSSPPRKVHALWVLERRGDLDDSTLESAARDDAREVRVHAMRIFGERPELDGPLHELVLGGLKDGDPFVRRAAAEALGLHVDVAHIRPLLDLLQSTSAEDTHLVHMVRMALRDQLRPATSWPRLAELSLSERDRRDIADVATGVPSPEAAAYLLGHVQHLEEPRARLVRHLHFIARHAARGDDMPLLELVRERGGEALPDRLALLKAIMQGNQERGSKVSAELTDAAADIFRELVDSPREKDVLAGIEMAGLFRLHDSFETLQTTVRSSEAPEAHRAAAMVSLAAVSPGAAVAILSSVVRDATVAVSLREQAANGLARLNRPEAQAELIAALASAPGRLQTTIAAGLAGTREGAEALLNTVAAGKASARLLQDRAVELRLIMTEIPGVKGRIEALRSGLPPADQRLNQLLKARRAGYSASGHDAAAGAKAFETHCAACHQIGGKGAKVGPQLDGIGVRGLERLLEDVLDPNLNVDQSFRTTQLALKDGQLVSGLLLREEGAVLVLADAQGKEIRVPAESVEERKISNASPMPANLAEGIAEPEFYQLLTYLLEQLPREDPAELEGK